MSTRYMMITLSTFAVPLALTLLQHGFQPLRYVTPYLGIQAQALDLVALNVPRVDFVGYLSRA